jgi:hypothetical protein
VQTRKDRHEKGKPLERAGIKGRGPWSSGQLLSAAVVERNLYSSWFREWMKPRLVARWDVRPRQRPQGQGEDHVLPRSQAPRPKKLFNAGLAGNKWRAIDFREGDKTNKLELKALLREAVAYNTKHSVPKSKGSRA